MMTNVYSPKELQRLKALYEKDYKGAVKGGPLEEAKLRKEFLEKYPNADVSRFIFSIWLNTKGKVDTREVLFKKPNDLSSTLNITSDAFKKNPDWVNYLYWPRGWSVTQDLPDFVINEKFSLNLNVISVFVTEKKKFTAHFEELDTTYVKPVVKEGEAEKKPYAKEEFDYLGNPYFTAIAATYVITNLCGISAEHLLNKIPRASSNIITSIVQYHFAYHLRRFLRDPTKLRKYTTGKHLNFLQEHTPVRKIWRTQYSSTTMKIEDFQKQQDNLGYITKK